MRNKAAEVKQQAQHYLKVLRWMLSAYHRQEKKSFWLIQVTMGISVVLGLTWLLGLIVGLQHLDGSGHLDQAGLSIILNLFDGPLWLWLSVLTLAGAMGFGFMYWSIHLGVQSILRFQNFLVNQVFAVIGQAEDVNWLLTVEDAPRKKVHRILKVSIQMTGLIVRRLTRMLIPLVTFFVAMYALIKLNLPLLMLLTPLSLVYLMALYFINRQTARNQVQLSGVSEVANQQLGGMADELIYKKRQADQALKDQFSASAYQRFSLLRYRRRLAEVHVVWLNGLILVLGSALVILAVSQGEADKIDWMNLILFIVAMRYAFGSIQELASATVGFSRFLPESELVYHLLHAPTTKTTPQSAPGWVFYFDVSQEKEAHLPQLLSLQHGAQNTWSAEQFAQQCEQAGCPTDLWVYAVRPKKFKQLVAKHQERISAVVLCLQGDITTYNDVTTFLTEFNPRDHLRHKAGGGGFDDEMF